MGEFIRTRRVLNVVEILMTLDPRERASYPRERASCPREKASYPRERTSYPRVNILYPRVKFLYPRVNVKYTRVKIFISQNFTSRFIRKIRKNLPVYFSMMMK